MSRQRPEITTPSVLRACAPADMSPPQTAFFAATRDDLSTRGPHSGGGWTQLDGALITITDPAGAVSTKCEKSLGALVSEENTICTVYAGPQIIGLDPKGEIRWMSGM